MATPIPKRAPRLRRAFAAALAASWLLSGCPATTTVAPSGFLSPVAGSAITPTKLREVTGTALFEGVATGPKGLVGSNIISNNGSAIISNNGSAIIANNGSAFTARGRFGLLAVSEVPIANAIVYMTDPEERFFAKKGEPVTTFTDEKGLYKFASGLPTDQVIIVNVMLADNRREVGFTVSKAGKNTVNVSLASTYVTEFLRDRARARGKKMGDFDLSRLSELTALTQKALDAGDLAVPDLTIGKINEMNQAYALAVGLNKQGLGDVWAEVLGARVLAVTTFAGSGETGYGGNGKAATEAQLYKPKGIARDQNGNYYLADEGNHMVRKIGVDGKISTYSGHGSPAFSGDDGQAKDAGLWWPRTVAVGPNNQLFIADTLNMRIRKVDLSTGVITTFAGDPEQANGSFLNDFGGDGGPASEARLAGVRGMAVDSQGGLVFSDTWDNDGGSWHHIRRIDPDGTIESLVGVDDQHGFNGDGKPGRETQINYVNQVAVDAQDNVYFADAKNRRIRKYDRATKIVTTVAGNGSEGTPEDGAVATEAPLNAPYGVAVDKQGRVFIGDRGVRRVFVVDTDGKIRTVAGGGTFAGDGEATAIVLSEPHDLYLDPDGNLLFCDSRAARVRKLWLQFGM